MGCSCINPEKLETRDLVSYSRTDDVLDSLSWRHFSRPKEGFRVRHYRYFFTISQQKPGKRNFSAKKILVHFQKYYSYSVAPATSMRRQSSGIFVAHEFFNPNGRCWQGWKGSHFHPNSLSPAVHGLIRCPCKRRSVTILLAGSPCGGPVAGSSSLQD